MPNLRGSEWLIIILLLVLLFGARRLPDAARSIGRSLRIFKAETKGLVDDSAAPAGPSQPAPTVTQSAPAPITPAAAPAVPQAAPLPPAPAVEPQAGGSLSPQPPSQA